jgi:hypothetical protein
MIFFLNRGLILEQEVVKALENYFKIVGISEYYENFTVSVTNKHPFARMILNDKLGKNASSLFTVVVVATESESIPAELAELGVGDTEIITLEPEDLISGEDGRSPIERRYEMITEDVMNNLRYEMEKREDNKLFGESMFIRRRDYLSIEIWAESPQTKNELYELIRLFVCGFLRDYLGELYKKYFDEINEQSPLVIFDSSVRGQRSNNYNLDFGIELCGAHITFEADYVIEQTIIDTELIDTNNLQLEVINHVKGYADRTRERIIGESDENGESGRTDGDETDNFPETAE